MPKILWIEDDYYHIRGLVRPLEKEGIEVVVAQSAVEGYEKLLNWPEYDGVIIDMIIPPIKSHTDVVPEFIKQWGDKKIGFGLLKWALEEKKISKPFIVLSVTAEQPFAEELRKLGVREVLLKQEVIPLQVKNSVLEVLEMKASKKDSNH